MKYTLHFLSFLMLMTFSSIQAQTDIDLTMEFDGVTRNYMVHLPPQYVDGASLPLVFNLHGNTSNAIQQKVYSNFTPIADQEGFIICHPNGLPIPGGTGNTWNVSFPGGSDTDDVGFIDAIIDELSATYNIDLTRVYSTGMSNGGYMSYKLACELTNKITAIASVTGSMVPSELSACAPSSSIPVMQIHGTADATVPYGGAVWTTGIEPLIDWWAAHNVCMDGPSVTDVPDINTDDNSTVEHYEYTSCVDDTKVELYKIDNGGHTWPTATFDLSGVVTNRDINASQVIWDFFKQYPEDLTPVAEVLATDIEVDIFPNPTKENIQIAITDTKIQSITLYDILGKEVIRKDFEFATSQIDLPMSDLNKGTYLLKVKTKKGIVTEKVVKQ